VPVFTAPDGRHAHFPTWSPDGRYLYVVLGMVPDALDIFRMRADGTGLERLTRHSARVTHPVFLDARTLLYLRSDGQQAGGTLHALDVETMTSRSLARGLERYLSLSATGDGRRIVATVANTKRTLWRGTVSDDGPTAATPVVPVALATASGWAPRFSHSGLLYVTWKGDGHALWRASTGGGGEIWQAAGTRIVGGPAVSMDGRRVALMVEREGRMRTLVMNADGTGPREVGRGVALRGEPDWAPDGASLAVGAVLDGQPHLVRLPLDGAPVSLVAAFGLNPVWSPSGRMVVYSGPGTSLPLPRITLPRGARRVRFVDDGAGLVVLRGDFRHKDLWRIDLATGGERQLTAVAGDFLIRDYDVSADGRQFVLERVQEHSDIVLIDRRP
jgi:Tol biopolymer transport system component